MKHHVSSSGQLHGAKDLAQDAVLATVDEVAKAHTDIARASYAVLGWFPIVAEPARAIEQVQRTITSGVYDAIRGINRLAADAADRLLDRVE
ncbi:MAG TPA: hypothetical protein VL334_00930 [Anaerolineae bacterium]|nr:hypothetical protein [Anaerolineae bacterium]